MIEPLDPTDADVAARIVEIQRTAYAVEAQLMGFDGIPQLRETPEHVQTLTDLAWRGSFVDRRLAVVMTGAANTPARALYLSEGFEREGDVEVVAGVRMARFTRAARPA